MLRRYLIIDNKYRQIWDKHLDQQSMKHLTKKIKGKQYARPFIINDGYFWPLEIKWQGLSNTLAELDLIESMEYAQKQIFSAFKIPKDLIQSSGDMLGKRLENLGKYGMAGAKASESFKIQLKKIEA